MTQWKKVTGKVDSGSREADIGRWESEFADTLTMEPGLTDLVQFKIETGLLLPSANGLTIPHRLY